MNERCRKVWELLESGGALDVEQQAHAASCPKCRAALRLFRREHLEGSAVPTEARGELGSRAREELTQLPRPTPWWAGAATLFGLELLCSFAAGIAVAHGQTARNVAPAVRFFGVLASVAAVMGLAAAAALSPGPGLRRVLWPLTVVAGLFVVLGGSGFDPGGSFLKGAFMCGAYELSTALLPFAATLFLLTRFFARPGQAFAGGLAAAGAGMLALHLHCPNGTPMHLLAGHVVPTLGAGLLAWAIRARLPSRSFAP